MNNEKEGQAKGERFVAASGINGAIPEFAERQRRDNRKRWNKNATRTVEKDDKTVTEGQYVQAYHVIQSFARHGQGSLDPTDPKQWEKAHSLGVEMARKVAGKTRLATVHTQIDGTSGCIHNHIVIDSIDKQTGRSFNSAWVKHKELVATHDQMLTEHGYTQIVEYPDTPGTKTAEKIEKSEERGLMKYRAWEADGKQGTEPFSVAILKQRIRQALAETTFTSFEEFDELAIDRYDIDVEQRGGNGRGITYAMYMKDERGDLTSYPSSRRRASKLGKNFEMDAVLVAIERNKQLQRQPQIDDQNRAAQAAQATAQKSPLHEDDEPTPTPARKPASKQSAPQPAAQTAAPREEPTPPRTTDAAIQQARRESLEEDDHQDTASQTAPITPAPPAKARRRKEPPPSLGSWAELRAKAEELARQRSADAANPETASALSEAPAQPTPPAAGSVKTPQSTEHKVKHVVDAESLQRKIEPTTEAEAPNKSAYQAAQERLAEKLAEKGLDGPEQQDEREFE